MDFVIDWFVSLFSRVSGGGGGPDT